MLISVGKTLVLMMKPFFDKVLSALFTTRKSNIIGGPYNMYRLIILVLLIPKTQALQLNTIRPVCFESQDRNPY
jgi:hypothetical protein